MFQFGTYLFFFFSSVFLWSRYNAGVTSLITVTLLLSLLYSTVAQRPINGVELLVFHQIPGRIKKIYLQ